MSDTTTYTETERDYSPGYYDEGDLDDDGNVEPYSSGTIAGTGTIKTLITGHLADRVRARTGREGAVFIVERHWDIGYCVTCSDEQIDFDVFIDDDQTPVYSTQYAASGSDILGAESVNNIAQFNEWLDGGEGSPF